MNTSFKDILQNFLNDMAYYKCVNLLLGQYSDTGTMTAYNKKENDGKSEASNNECETKVAVPKITFCRLASTGNPIDFVFSRNKDGIKLSYGFKVETDVKDALPLLICEASLYLEYKDETDKSHRLLLKHVLNDRREQNLIGDIQIDRADIFLALKDVITKGGASISWTAKISWLDVSSEEMQANISNSEYKPNPITSTIYGTIPIAVTEESASYDTMFKQAEGILCWEKLIGPNDELIYFMDTMRDDTICFLPQEYRVKAMDTNAPEMTTSLESEGANGGFHALIRFRIGPHILPSAKREAYQFLQNRKGKKYFKLRYAGYDSARFEWGAEMEGGSLYGPDGFKALSCDEKIEAAPESSFFIVMRSPTDGLINLFHELITQKGIVIGNVFFTVHEGLTGENKREIGPIPVKLDLQELTGFQTQVSILENTDKEIKMPFYQAKITNHGKYALVIGGVEMTARHWKKNEVTDVYRNLRCTNAWPTTLNPGESIIVSLTQEQISNMKKKQALFFIDKDYWNELTCEPYDIRLLDKDIKSIVNEYNQDAVYDLDKWVLKVGTNFEWADFPNLIAVWVHLKNNLGVDEKVALIKGEEAKVIITPNLNALIKTQSSEKRVFNYRVALVTRDNADASSWSEWTTYSEADNLYIIEEDIKTLYNL